MKKILILALLMMSCSGEEFVDRRTPIEQEEPTDESKKTDDGSDGDVTIDIDVIVNDVLNKLGRTDCTVKYTNAGAEISCPGKNTVFIYNGKDGVDGKDGADGLNGADGINGQDGADGQDGTDGLDGQDGADGQDAVILEVFALPTQGACVNIGNGYYAENEGDHIDIYKNAACNHIGGGNGVICNDMRHDHGSGAGEICWVENYIQFSVEYEYSDTVLYKLTFNQ